MSSGEERELQPLIRDGRKRPGCCASHPWLCSCTLTVILSLCLAVILFGGLFGSKLDQAVKDAIAEHVKLKNGSAATKQFAHSSAPLYTTYYMFNLTNPEEVASGTAIPILKEIGPYAYREDRQAFDLEWIENGTVLRYNTNITYTWDQEKSNGDPKTDIIITVNVPLFGIFKAVESNSTMVKLLIKAIDWLKGKTKWDGLFVKHSVSDFLWGYKDPILSRLHEFHPYLHFLPDENPIFGFGNISSVETPNRVYTGVDDLTKVAQYIEWNGNTSMSGWGNKYAAMINGTGGYSFHPGVTREESLLVFIDELYRSGYFSYCCDIIDHGIRLYKFVLPDDELKNTTQKEAGFPGNNPDGVLNLSPVVPAHVPLYASKPHFLHADPVFRKGVVGMHPNATKHDSYVGVEPITGAVLNAAKRIQVNLKLERNSNFPELKNVRDVMLPIYYAEQRGAVTAELANDFKNEVFTVRYGVMGSLWAVMGIAGVISAVCGLCLVGVLIQHCRSRSSDRHIQYSGL